FGFAENTDDLFVGKTLLHGDVLMWLMKTLLTSGCTNQRGAGQMNTVNGLILLKLWTMPLPSETTSMLLNPYWVQHCTPN
ncbi:hypothetical protein N8Y79_25810, partial [Enterobacter hormaechei subsp. steigerwaltii]|nr:hypothetical protein [Enterobacter hormaechei subsp. steigerwaltii]